MSKPVAHQKNITIEEMSSPGVFDNFKVLVDQKYPCKKIEDKGQYVVGHCKVRLSEEDSIDIVAYTSGKIMIRASPKTDKNKFEELCRHVEIVAKQAIAPVSTSRPITAQRAKTLLEYASKCKSENELDRIIITVLADTAVEIILTEMMKSLQIEGPPLKEGIPDKIKRLNDKGQSIYKENELKNIHDFRNGIVHRGEMPDHEQATKCLKIAKEFCDRN